MASIGIGEEVAAAAGFSETTEEKTDEVMSAATDTAAVGGGVTTGYGHRFLDNSERIIAAIGPILQFLDPNISHSEEHLTKAPTCVEQTEYLVNFLTEMVQIFEEQLAVRIVDANAPNRTLLDESHKLQDIMRGINRGDTTHLHVNLLTPKSKSELLADCLDKPLCGDKFRLICGDILVFQFTELVYKHFVVGTFKPKVHGEDGIELAKYLYTGYKSRDDRFDIDFYDFVRHKFAQMS